MHSFFAAILDVIFPPSAHERVVRTATGASIAAEYAPSAFGDVVVLASYRTPLMRALVQQAKFRRDRRAIELLGQLLAKHLGAAFPNKMRHTIHLIPIPLSAERLQERGYNQTVEIARAAQAHVPSLHIHATLLKKMRHTASQTSLSRAERLENLADAFGVGDSTLPLDTPLILFDDIVTTGSTLAEAARTLRSVGFTRISCLVLAH
jgi:ComF family protein